jgi:hypothetical protein
LVMEHRSLPLGVGAARGHGDSVAGTEASSLTAIQCCGIERPV